MNAEQIETTVSKLLILKKNNSKEQIDAMIEFDEFKEKNRMFYDIIMAGEIDMPIFNYMMKMKRKLEAGEDSYGVDVKFGQYMADKYLPKL